MGGASGQQSQSQGSSSGTSNFSSFPQNLQYPQYQAMAPTVETGVSSAINQSSPQAFSSGYNQFAPTTLWNPNLGQYVDAANANQNPLVAPVTGGQQTQLAGVNQFSPLGQIYNPNTPTAMAQGGAQQLTNAAWGGGNPIFNGTMQGAQNIYGQAPQNFATGVGAANQAAGFAGGGQDISPAQQALGARMDPRYAASLAFNPATASVVQGAVNPLIQSFNAQTIPGLQGAFTAAGQRVNAGAGGGVGGSSAFDIAGANALTGLGANIGNVASNIMGGAYNQGLAQTGAAPGQFEAGQQQILSGLESAGTTSANVAAAQAAAQTAGVNASVNAANAGVNQLATAATTNQQIATQQLNDTINALNANALPQMTQQYGINQGLQLYNSQVNQLLTAMGLGGQISQPAIGNIASGGGSSSGQNTSSSGGKGFTLF